MSNELLALARERLAERTSKGARLADYSAMAEAFQASTDLDRRGLGQALAEFDRAGILPPTPPTFRGRLGGAAIGLMSGAFWWIARAFGLRDAVLRAMYEALIEQRIELRQMRARIEALEQARR